MKFEPMKDILSAEISQFYSSILAKLEIPEDIDAGEAYREINDHLGLKAIYNYLFKEMPKEIQEMQKMPKEIQAQISGKMCLNIGKLAYNLGFQLKKVDLDAAIFFEKIHRLLNLKNLCIGMKGMMALIRLTKCLLQKEMCICIYLCKFQ